MSTSSYTTNPKRIVQVPPSNIDLSFRREPKTRLIQTFSFGGVDLTGLHGAGVIPPEAKIFLEIRNRQDVQRVSLGTLASQKLMKDEAIELSGSTSSLTWHFFIAVGYAIRASNENVKAKDASDEDAQGLLLVEPEELGEVLWRVHPVDGREEPKLKVNLDQSLNILAHLKARDDLYRAFIIPNAIEQILRVLASFPGVGDPSEWQTKWNLFLQEKGIGTCPETESIDEKEEWVEAAVNTLAKEWKLVTNMKIMSA
jgi:hypothetical protein